MLLWQVGEGLRKEEVETQRSFPLDWKRSKRGSESGKTHSKRLFLNAHRDAILKEEKNRKTEMKKMLLHSLCLLCLLWEKTRRPTCTPLPAPADSRLFMSRCVAQFHTHTHTDQPFSLFPITSLAAALNLRAWSFALSLLSAFQLSRNLIMDGSCTLQSPQLAVNPPTSSTP